MGVARILSGGPTGRYTIEVDSGTAEQAALLAELNTRIVALDAEILAAQVVVAEADAIEQDIINQMGAAQEAYVIAATASGGDILPSSEIDGLIFLLNTTRAQNTPLRIKLDVLEHTRKSALQLVASLNSANLLLTKQAWCVDLTEDAAPGTDVATVDIPGEQNLQLLAPGCRAWTSGDGRLRAREIMSPDQAYLNAAILPGWQKFKPTYRWGTLTAVNYAADTADVALANAVSSAQSLGVNQTSALAGVPVVYGTCNATPFLVGDRVVVQFIGQDWSNPRIIGFLDNPKSCNWPCIGEGGPFNTINGGLAFESLIPSLFAQLTNDSLDVRARVDGGAWITIAYSRLIGGVIWAYEYPSSAFDPNFLSLQVQTGAGVYPDRIHCIVQPPTTPGVRKVVEFAVYIAGNIVFNIAMEDRGNGVNAPAGTGAAKSTGGIDLRPGSNPVTLLAYTLISSTP